MAPTAQQPVLEQEVPVEKARLALLYRAAEMLGVGLDIDQILSGLCDLLLEFIGADRVGIVVFDERGGAIYRHLVGDYASDAEADRMLHRMLQGAFAARVMQTRQGDIRQSNGRTCLMMVPLLVPDRVVGLISLFSKSSDYFTQEHLELVSAISSRAATVIENRRLYESERQRANQLAALNQIAAKVSHSLDLRQVLDVSLESIVGAIGFDFGRVYLLSQGEEWLRPQSFLKNGRPPVAQTGESGVAVGKGVTGRAASTGQVSYVEDVGASLLSSEEPIWTNDGFSTVVGVPLGANSRILAVVTVASTTPRRLDAETLAWLQAMGDLAGAATANAMRYCALERIVQERTAELSEANDQLEREGAERALAADALRREHDLVTRIMETSPTGILMANRQGEITFANARAEELLGLDRDEITRRTYNTPEGRITDNDGNAVPDEQLPFRLVVDSGKPIYDVQHAIERPDGQRVLLSVSGAPLIGISDEIAGGVFAVEDVTARVEVDQALAHRLQFETLLSTLATRFLSCDALGIDACIESALGELGLFTGVERTYVFLASQDEVEGMYEWCAAGIAPGKVPVQGRPFSEFAWWLAQFTSSGRLHIPALADLPAESGPMRDRLIGEGVETIVAVPLRVESSRIGFLGLASIGHPKAWSDADLTLLEAASAIFAIALARKDAFLKLRFQAQLLANVRDSVIGTDLGRTITYWGKGAEDLFGYTADEVLGQNLSYVIPDISEEEKAAVDAEASRSETWSGRLLQRRKDGSSFWSDTKVFLVRDSHGARTGYIGVDRDISSQMQAEQSLRESEARWRSLVQNAPVTVTLADRDGTIVFINRTSPGRTVESVTGRRVYDFLPPKATGKVRRLLSSVFDAAKDVEFEAVMDRDDGSKAYYDSRATPIMRDGQVVSALIISSDITKRMEIQQALRESEDRNRAILDALPDMLVQLSRDGEYLSVRPASGWDPLMPVPDLVGKNLSDILLPEVVDLSMAAIGRALATGEVQTYEYQLEAADSLRDFEARMVPSGPDTVLAIVRDITEQVEAEEALRDSERQNRALLDAIPDMLAQLSRDGTYLGVRPARDWDPIVPVSDIIGKRLHDVVPPDNAELTLHLIHQALETQSPQIFEYQLLTKEGTADYESRIVPSGDETVLAMVRDITERKRMEMALREQEAENQALVDAIPDALSRIRRDGTFLSVKGARDWDMLDAPEIYVGRSIYDVLPREMAERRMTHVLRALETGEPQTYEYQLVQDGETRYYESRVVVSGPDETLGIVRDVTDQRRAEEELRVRDAAIESAMYPMVMTDLQGNVAYANRAALDLWGYETLEEVNGRPGAEFWLNRQDAQRDLERVLSEGSLVSEGRAIRRDGSLIEVQMASTLVRDRDGSPLCVMSSGVDVSARNRLERELKQHANELGALNEIGMLLSSSLDLGDMLEGALDRILQLLGLQGGAIYLLDEQRGLLNLAAHKALPSSALPSVLGTIRVGQGLAGQVASTREATVMHTKDYPDPKRRNVLSREGIVVTVAIPLVYHDRVVGVLNGASYEEREFTRRELDLMATIGAQVGSSLENAHLFREVQEARDNVRALSVQVTNTLEMERERLSRELHDEVGQALTALKLSLQMTGAGLPSGSSALRGSLDDTLELVDDTLNRVRFLAAGLRPSALEVLGLVPSLREQVGQFSRLSGIQSTFSAGNLDRLELPDRDELALYRIVQEALTNVLRHAEATSVSVSLERTEPGFRVVIQDDGIGFDADSVRMRAARDGHLGLIGMSERAELLGAELQIDSVPGQGTRISLNMAVPRKRGRKTWTKSESF